jgi:hypothetical protein
LASKSFAFKLDISFQPPLMVLVFSKTFSAPFVFIAALDLDLVLSLTNPLDDHFTLAF